jgi:hypothetical protein
LLLPPIPHLQGHRWRPPPPRVPLHPRSPQYSLIPIILSSLNSNSSVLGIVARSSRASFGLELWKFHVNLGVQAVWILRENGFEFLMNLGNCIYWVYIRLRRTKLCTCWGCGKLQIHFQVMAFCVGVVRSCRCL